MPFYDDLTDDELRDPDRPGYAAMPIVLPNGDINANRFTPPPDDKAVIVRFQDRHWYGVDTSGDEPNTLYYSEVDEPESVPESNQLILQQNAKDADSLTALIPFGSTLLAMQHRHAYSITFVRQPVLDAQVTPIGYRGALNQRCWDIHGGACYVMDQYGVYGIAPTGQIEPLSEAIDDMFTGRIDFGKSKWCSLIVDPKHRTLRCFVAFREDESSGRPTRVLCYSLETKTWWVEMYPQSIAGGAHVLLTNGDYRCVYAATGGVYVLNEGSVDLGRGAITSVTLTGSGSGYRTPPNVYASGGSGGKVQATINGEGQVTGLWIMSTGNGYTSGDLLIDPPPSGGTRATGTFTASSTTADTPLFPTYRYKSGSVSYLTDVQEPAAGSEMSRAISLSYAPQPSACELSMRLYYNNAPHPRPNVAARDRGTGFAHDVVDAAARLDMGRFTTEFGADTGVSRALYAGRTMDDVNSSDRSVAVELVGARKNHDPVVLYALNIYGIGDA